MRAISKPGAEIVISVGPGRILKALMDFFPGLNPAINRLSGRANSRSDAGTD